MVSKQDFLFAKSLQHQSTDRSKVVPSRRLDAERGHKHDLELVKFLNGQAGQALSPLLSSESVYMAANGELDSWEDLQESGAQHCVFDTENASCIWKDTSDKAKADKVNAATQSKFCEVYPTSGSQERPSALGYGGQLSCRLKNPELQMNVRNLFSTQKTPPRVKKVLSRLNSLHDSEIKELHNYGLLDTYEKLLKQEESRSNGTRPDIDKEVKLKGRIHELEKNIQALRKKSYEHRESLSSMGLSCQHEPAKGCTLSVNAAPAKKTENHTLGSSQSKPPQNCLAVVTPDYVKCVSADIKTEPVSTRSGSKAHPSSPPFEIEPVDLLRLAYAATPAQTEAKKRLRPADKEARSAWDPRYFWGQRGLRRLIDENKSKIQSPVASCHFTGKKICNKENAKEVSTDGQDHVEGLCILQAITRPDAQNSSKSVVPLWDDFECKAELKGAEELDMRQILARAEALKNFRTELALENDAGIPAQTISDKELFCPISETGSCTTEVPILQSRALLPQRSCRPVAGEEGLLCVRSVGGTVDRIRSLLRQW